MAPTPMPLRCTVVDTLQGCLTHNKMPTPLGPPKDPRYRATVGSYRVAFSYELGIPVGVTTPGVSVKVKVLKKRGSSSNGSNANGSKTNG